MYYVYSNPFVASIPYMVAIRVSKVSTVEIMEIGVIAMEGNIKKDLDFIFKFLLLFCFNKSKTNTIMTLNKVLAQMDGYRKKEILEFLNLPDELF